MGHMSVNLDINTVLSILPCDVLNRFDKNLVSLPIVHIAITSQYIKKITTFRSI